ncbi:MAG: DMT family transporter [Pseudomonadota bacterium]
MTDAEGVTLSAASPSPHRINTEMGTAEWAKLAFLSLLWGGSFFFIEIALAGFPPLTLVALRVGFAALGLWIFVFATRRPLPRSVRFWAAIGFSAILNNALPFSLMSWGQTQVGASLASILNATTPIFTVLVAGIFLKDEPLSARRLIGVLVGALGVAVVIGPTAILGARMDWMSLLGQLAFLGGTLSYATASVYSRRFGRMGIDPIVAATGQLSAAVLIMVPVSLIFERPLSLPLPGIDAWLAVLGLALLSTALAFILYFQLLAKAGATNVILVTFLIPVSAISLGILLLGEHLSGHQVGGMVIIAAGLFIVDGRLVRRLLRPRGGG